jgi:catechol 2,3-dioxygenase-like lactoylglutathione lyase family enzyme
MTLNTEKGTGSAARVVAVDHAGFVVTDLQAAVRFFVNELGFEATERRGESLDRQGDRMARQFSVHPRAVCRFAFVQLGSRLIEFLEWDAPDRNTDSPRNSDAGGRHLALTVEHLDELLTHLGQRPGFAVHEKTDRGFAYVSTPFGLELQLIPT